MPLPKNKQTPKKTVVKPAKAKVKTTKPGGKKDNSAAGPTASAKNRITVNTGALIDQKPASEQPEKKKITNGRSLGLYRKIALSFIILTGLLLAAIFYFSFVKVSIVILPNPERLSGDLIIDVYNQDRSGPAKNNALTGVVKQVKLEQSKTYPASGQEVISQGVTGQVTIINNYNKSQPLVATTRLLSTDNKLFRLKNTVNVPAGGQVEAEVYADEPGPEMEIDPGEFTIPGLWAGLQDKIYGVSREPMKYSQIVKKYINQSDIDEAVKDLKQNLLAKAEAEISRQYQNYNQIKYEIDSNSISQQLDGKVGEERDDFNLTMATLVTVIAYNDDKIVDLARQKLLTALPDDKDLIEFSQQNISYTLSGYNIDQGQASLQVNFSGKMALKANASVIDRDKLLGLTQEQLNAYLKSLPEIAGFEVNFFPTFIKKVPNLVDRIEIKIKN